MSCDIGVYGLAVMGMNLALNIASRGFKVCVANRTASRVDDSLAAANNQGLSGCVVGVKDFKDFVAEIKQPRRIVMLVQAGAPVDALISSLLPLLSKGDLLVDGGNEFFEKTEQRIERCAAQGILYMGLGVSGGEEGARHGPSLMAGGAKEAWNLMQPILISIAAKIDPKKTPEKYPGRGFTEEECQNSCACYLGSGGSGNFVKMVHNGIEYGDMQLIAEAYTVMKHCFGMENDEIAETFLHWNSTELESYLVEIVAHVIKKRRNDGYLVDQILDSAGSKGTGKWTAQQAAEWGVPVPCISGALDSRYVSSHRQLRERLSALYGESWPQQQTACQGPKPSLDELKAALYVGKICCYAQGMHLISTASKEKGWGLNFAEVSRIWKGGCIIRARFLDVMEKAFKANPEVENILFVESIRNTIVDNIGGLRQIVGFISSVQPAVRESESRFLLSLPVMNASYNYITSFTCNYLPTNLIQAQRDFFGAHEFELRKSPGKFHHESSWAS